MQRQLFGCRVSKSDCTAVDVIGFCVDGRGWTGGCWEKKTFICPTVGTIFKFQHNMFHKDNSSGPNSTRSTSRWPGWLRTFTSIVPWLKPSKEAGASEHQSLFFISPFSATRRLSGVFNLLSPLLRTAWEDVGWKFERGSSFFFAKPSTLVTSNVLDVQYHALELLCRRLEFVYHRGL